MSTTPKSRERLEAKHRAAVLALMRAEKKLAAAFTRWAKLREQVRRYDRLADKALAGRLGGEYDPRDLAALGEYLGDRKGGPHGR